MGSSVSFHYFRHLIYWPETLFGPLGFLERYFSCHGGDDGEVVVVVPGRKSCHASGDVKKGRWENIFWCLGSTSWSPRLKTFWCLESICV